MEIVRKKIRDLDRAAYNPRIDLIPGDTEYENLRRSIITYGMIIPVVWNQRTNRVVGGHQRLTVLENEGETEVDVSVVDLDETQERQLNVALNKIEGGWDEEKLAALLAELGGRRAAHGLHAGGNRQPHQRHRQPDRRRHRGRGAAGHRGVLQRQPHIR